MSDSRLVQLAKQAVTDSDRWFGDTGIHQSVPHMTLAMCGEVGEFANLVKKIERRSLDLNDASTRIRLAEELDDVFVYMLNIAGLLHIDLEAVHVQVRGKNEKRFMAERVSRNGRPN